MTNEPLLKPKEIAARLRISTETVLAACRSGALHAIKVGRQYRATEAAVEAWLKGMKGGDRGGGSQEA